MAADYPIHFLVTIPITLLIANNILLYYFGKNGYKDVPAVKAVLSSPIMLRLSIYLAFSRAAEPIELYAVSVASIACEKLERIDAKTRN